MGAQLPADEYCLLWINWWPVCLTKGEWASWVQAIGAIVAIGVAIAAPLLHAHALRRSAHRAQLDYLRALTDRADELVGVVLQAFDDGSLAGYMDHVHNSGEFEELAGLIERLPLHEIADPTLVLHLLRVKSALLSVTHAANWVYSGWMDANVDPDEGEESLRRSRREVQEAVEAVKVATARFG